MKSRVRSLHYYSWTVKSFFRTIRGVKSYEEACGLAKALDVLGERWTLLVIRQLMFGPQRFTDLEAGLPGVPPSLLSSRLKELSDAGLVGRRTLPPPAASTVYELSDAGRELEGSIVSLARWGGRFGPPVTEEDIVNAQCMALGLRWLFRPEAAKHVRATYELRAFGNVVSAVVNRGRIDVSVGPADTPDLAIEVLDRAFARAMSTGGMPASDAKMSEHVVLEGSEDALEDFLKIFAMDPVPTP
jgi:DNA-binding HxlR family transcriptional regulator